MIGIVLGMVLLALAPVVWLTLPIALLFIGVLGSLVLALTPAALSDHQSENRAVALAESSLVSSVIGGIVPAVVGLSQRLGFGWGGAAIVPVGMLGLLARNSATRRFRKPDRIPVMRGTRRATEPRLLVLLADARLHRLLRVRPDLRRRRAPRIPGHVAGGRRDCALAPVLGHDCWALCRKPSGAANRADPPPTDHLCPGRRRHRRPLAEPGAGALAYRSVPGRVLASRISTR